MSGALAKPLIFSSKANHHQSNIIQLVKVVWSCLAWSGVVRPVQLFNPGPAGPLLKSLPYLFCFHPFVLIKSGRRLDGRMDEWVEYQTKQRSKEPLKEAKILSEACIQALSQRQHRSR